jgi:tetratricopeptide (TPR) repeat protein
MKKILLATLLGVAGVFIFLGAANYFKKKTNDLDAKTFIEKIRNDNKAGFDSLQKAIKYENDLNFRIKKSIADNEFTTAIHLMDSLPLFGKPEAVLRYQGSILEKKGDYTNALKKYDSVIINEKYSIATNDKARVLIKMNRFKEAIAIYKIPFEWDNYDNALQVATTFELMQKKDSALNYYKIYLEHYPNDLSVKQKVLVIEKNK